MPLITTTPEQKIIAEAQTVNVDKTVIESVTTDALYTREPGALFTHRIERFWLLNGAVVNARVVTVRPDVLAAELARTEVAAAFAEIRRSNYRMLQAQGEAPNGAELVE